MLSRPKVIRSNIPEKNMRTIFHLMLATIAIGSYGVHAQQTPPSSGGTVVSSSPGKASVKTTVDLNATVTAVDKATRKITLKGSQGKTIDVVAGDDVRNFDQLRVGDNVSVRYQEALTLELRKTKGAVGATESGAVTRSQPGERPGGTIGREVQVVAEVVDVNPSKSTISLKGPAGNVVDLKVQNPDQFKVVKKGDLVDATYTEALAVAVTPKK
jgi:hypothetical protein